MFSVCLPRHCTATLPPLHSVAAIAALFDQRHSYNFVFALLTTNGFRRQRPQLLQGIVVRLHLAAHVRCESCLAQHLHTTTTDGRHSLRPQLLQGIVVQFHLAALLWHSCFPAAWRNNLLVHFLPSLACTFAFIALRRDSDSDSYLVFSRCSVMHSDCMYQSCDGRQQ